MSTVETIPHGTAADSIAAARLDPKAANVLYHDAAARAYDAKWAISFDHRSRAYVRDRAERMLPRARYHRVLEVGSGTGFFLLNLWQTGFVREAHATDISPGMLQVMAESARRLGCDLRLRTADAERLPYDDGEFDLVVGHAFLHHLPDPEGSLREMFRVLAPGGAVFIAGEPTSAGDRIAGWAKRAGLRVGRVLPRIRPDLFAASPRTPPSDDERILRELEFAVDLHTFEPARVAEWALAAGFRSIRTETEELVSSLFGWTVRTLESQFRPGVLGERWGRFAYGGWRRLYRLDQDVLYRILPHRIFYNLLLYAEKPASVPD